jgi:hypothetical protein
MKEKLKKNIVWIFFGIVLLGAIQFFVVLAKYQVIESQKVFWGVILYAVPVITLASTLFSRRLTYHMFYSHEKVNLKTVSRINRFKNSLVSILLMVLTFSFITYDTIIQTNDWLGKDKYQHIETEIIDVEQRNTTRARSTGSGNSRWIITIEINGELVELTTKTYYEKGELFEMTLNLGGAWGIIYAG